MYAVCFTCGSYLSAAPHDQRYSSEVPIVSGAVPNNGAAYPRCRKSRVEMEGWRGTLCGACTCDDTKHKLLTSQPDAKMFISRVVLASQCKVFADITVTLAMPHWKHWLAAYSTSNTDVPYCMHGRLYYTCMFSTRKMGIMSIQGRYC